MKRLLVAALFALLVQGALASAQAVQTGAARDLPSTVISAFEKAYPDATMTSSSEERQEGQVAFRVEATQKGRRVVAVYSVAGKLLESAEQVSEADLPKPVADAVRAYPKASFVKGMKIVRGANVRYELTLRGTRKTTMIVSPNGKVASFK